MTGTILLFGFDSLLNILALSAAVAPFEAEVVPVARGDYNKPIGVLAGLDTEAAPSMPYAGGTLGGRMVVLCGLEDRLEPVLAALNQAGADCMKAVLTPHNRAWNALKLYGELQRERAAMERGGRR